MFNVDVDSNEADMLHLEPQKARGTWVRNVPWRYRGQSVTTRRCAMEAGIPKSRRHTRRSPQ
jgi:hypothetical protein